VARLQPPSVQLVEAAYGAAGSFWRLHLKGGRYAVDVKLPGIELGNQSAADLRVKVAGLEVSWLICTESKSCSGKVLLFRSVKGKGKTPELKGLRHRQTNLPSRDFAMERALRWAN
jgi:hypothetical protein